RRLAGPPFRRPHPADDRRAVGAVSTTTAAATAIPVDVVARARSACRDDKHSCYEGPHRARKITQDTAFGSRKSCLGCVLRYRRSREGLPDAEEQEMGIISFIKGGVQELAIARPDSAKGHWVYKHPDQTIPMKAQLTV